VTGVLAACSVPTPERSRAGVASKRALTLSSLVILARDGSKSGGASALDSITAGSVFQPRPGDSAALDSIPSSASVPRDGRSSGGLLGAHLFSVLFVLSGETEG